jgi:two-component sensor histidine kinase
MTRKAQALAESEARLEAERQLLGNVASINSAVQGLTNVVEYENEHFAERIQRVEVQLSQLYGIVRNIAEHLDEERADDWWKGDTPE